MSRLGMGRLVVLVSVLVTGCATRPVAYEHEETGSTRQVQGVNLPDSAKIHTELAGQYYSRGQYEIAIEEANIALQAKPDYAPAYNLLGLVSMDLHEDVQAQQYFERALRLSPGDSDTNHNYGWFVCQRQPEKLALAIRHFMVAIKNSLYATPEKSYTNAGVCTMNQADYGRAEDYFHKALSIRPAYSPAVLGLADTAFRSNNLKQARIWLSRHMQISLPTAESLWLGVRIERKAGDQETAASYALQLQKRFPHSREAIALRDSK
jgi:type IV pilus assembly protein PilF